LRSGSAKRDADAPAYPAGADPLARAASAAAAAAAAAAAERVERGSFDSTTLRRFNSPATLFARLGNRMLATCK
jgi:uncharacterized protein YciI